MADACDSCGRDDDPVEVVHRVYVTPEAWDSPGREEVVETTERWCFVCRTHYPHRLPEEVGDAGDAGDSGEAADAAEA